MTILTEIDGMDGYGCRICKSTNGAIVSSGIRDWEYGVEGQWSHIACATCGTVQIHPFPSTDDLKRAYDIDYHGYLSSTSKGVVYSTLFRINDEKLRRQIIKFIAPESVLLDIGCGSGEFLARIKKFVPGVKVTGVDFSDQAVSMAGKIGVPAFCGMFMDFESYENTYDVIFMNNYLEHTTDPAEELRKCFRLLKDDGVLIGEVPNFRSIDRLLFGKFWGGNHAPRHTFHFTPETLTNILNQSGFLSVQIMQQTNTSHFALSIQNYLQRNCQDLRHNSRLIYGRAKYYTFLLLLLIPFNLIAGMLGYSGIMKFIARVR